MVAVDDFQMIHFGILVHVINNVEQTADVIAGFTADGVVRNLAFFGKMLHILQ